MFHCPHTHPVLCAGCHARSWAAAPRIILSGSTRLEGSCVTHHIVLAAFPLQDSPVMCCAATIVASSRVTGDLYRRPKHKCQAASRKRRSCSQQDTGYRMQDA